MNMNAANKCALKDATSGFVMPFPINPPSMAASLDLNHVVPFSPNDGAAAAISSAAITPISAVTSQQINNKPAICRYFLRGCCRYGTQCHFSHDTMPALINQTSSLNPFSNINRPSTSNSSISLSTSTSSTAKPPLINICSVSEKPSLIPISSIQRASTSRSNDWVNAPVFVPGNSKANNSKVPEVEIKGEDGEEGACESLLSLDANYDNSNLGAAAVAKKSWAEVVSSNLVTIDNGKPLTSDMKVEYADPKSKNEVCPFDGPCPYDGYCVYTIHLELCKMCDRYCLHPTDQDQRRQHNKDCLQHHEQAMEFSFAIARSKDKTCGICFDTIMEKAGREKRFGILPNCCHIFCLECIRKWRQATQFEHKITRSCPECRVCSDFVCPSAFWVETKEQKDKLLTDYREALNAKDCKYFKKGAGKCPFGNKCFYKHALPNGDLVDVGNPKRTRKIRGSDAEYVDLFDIYLWQFVDRSHSQWFEFLSSSTDDSDDSYFSDDD